MTSLFDQFEQAIDKSKNNNPFGTPEMSSMGYINMSLETPIFTRIEKDFVTPSKITHAAINNKILIVAMANKELFKMNLNNPSDQFVIPFAKYTSTGRLTNLFLDPNGNHILLSFTPQNQESTPELLYLSSKSNKIKPTTKFKNHIITQVAWNVLNESNIITGTILLGTSKGLILETELVGEGEKFFNSSFSLNPEQYVKQIFDIGKGTNTAITGLHYHRVIGTNQYIIFAATPSRLYYFNGTVTNNEDRPLLQQIFNRYLNIDEKKTFIEYPNNAMWYSCLNFWSENLVVPNNFVWVTENKIVYGQIDNTISSMEEMEEKLVIFQHEDCSESKRIPINCALTEFHCLLGYTDQIKGICLLNKDTVYEDNYNEAFRKLIDIIKDNRTGMIWAITENTFNLIKITKEERNVWQIFCDNRQFDLAKKYSRSNQACYNQVLRKEADMLFNSRKNYELSAQRYAEAQARFEEICLKFFEANQFNALKIFLNEKLNKLNSKNEKTQITMIVIWMAELYLNNLEDLRLNDENPLKYENLQKEFEDFLKMEKLTDCIMKNKSTIYKLMASHGDKDNLIKFTKFNRDYEQLIRHHLYKNNYLDALTVLKNQNNYDLYYQFASILIQEIPKETVEILIEQGRKLSPIKLLPILVSCEGEIQSKQVIKYLEFAMDKLKITDEALHNFLLSLYAKYDPDDALMTYLKSQGDEIHLINYNVYFALKICEDNNLTRPCVHLYGLLELWEKAVDLALTIDQDYAKLQADKPPENDIETRRKLWLKIAKHVIKKDNGGSGSILEAMQFLQCCDLIKIEDILPYFSDFVTIDEFKDTIYNSLNNYNKQIQYLKDEMEDATISAEQVKNDINKFKNRFTIIKNNDNCELCNQILMIRSFYIFPCEHKFHSDCLLNELSPNLGNAKKNKLNDLQKQLKLLNNQIDNLSTGSGLSTKDTIKTEIDNILASECLLCGENMIKNIDKPFILDSDYKRIKKEWE